MIAQRYIVVEGSQSCHCCFQETVVDTTKPVIIGDEHYEGQFEAICETFEEGHGQLIADALNLVEAAKS